MTKAALCHGSLVLIDITDDEILPLQTERTVNKKFYDDRKQFARKISLKTDFMSHLGLDKRRRSINYSL